MIASQPSSERRLHAYLLGEVDFGALLALQRRLVYEISGERSTGALILCEHAPTITVGRLGSRLHVRLSPEQLAARRWPVRWVNRGAGCLLHAPGQVNIYAVLALDALGYSPIAYLHHLHEWLAETLRSFHIDTSMIPDRSGLWVEGRQLAHVGIAVRHWVAYFGATLNVKPNLEWFRTVDCDGAELPMTSMERALRTTVRPAAVRQALVESFSDRFGFDRLAVFHAHPALNPKAPNDAIVTRTG